LIGIYVGIVNHTFKQKRSCSFRWIQRRACCWIQVFFQSHDWWLEKTIQCWFRNWRLFPVWICPGTYE